MTKIEVFSNELQELKKTSDNFHSQNNQLNLNSEYRAKTSENNRTRLLQNGLV